MAPLCLAVLLWASPAAADTPESAKVSADAVFQENTGTGSSDAVVDDGTGHKKVVRLTKSTGDLTVDRKKAVPPAESKLPTELAMGGAALLGGLQGWFSHGLVGAAAGAGLGLAAAWLFSKKDYGGAFGVTAGAIVGTAFGGPIGGIIGAAVGGLIGHFVGKLFGF